MFLALIFAVEKIKYMIPISYLRKLSRADNNISCYSNKHLWGHTHASRTVLSTADAKWTRTGSCPPAASHLIRDSMTEALTEPQAVSKVPVYA